MKHFCCITGASRGLGEFLAHVFWQQGYSLLLVGRQYETLHKVARTLPCASGQVCHCIAADLSKPTGAQKVLDWLKEQCVAVEVLINNAGMHGPVGSFVENDISQWTETMQCNMLSPMHLSKGMLPGMLKSEFGRIINISGGGASGPRPKFSAYAVSKTALVRFSETLAAELISTGVTVNAIAPGAMKTQLLGEVLTQGSELAGEKEWSVAKRIFEEGGASMQRVADLCLFLASAASNGITGKLISAVWDPWESLPDHTAELASDIYTLRRITPKDRGQTWGNDQ